MDDLSTPAGTAPRSDLIRAAHAGRRATTAQSQPAPGTSASPGPAPGRVAQVLQAGRASVWAPIVLRVGAIVALMLGLGVVGTAAIGAEAADAAKPSDLTQPGPTTSWLAPTDPCQPAAATSSSPPIAPSAAPQSDKPQSDGGAPAATPSQGMTGYGRVILNTAQAEDLRRLPGVGAKRAAAILTLRERLGRFRRPSDLLRVRGIGVKTLKRMLPHLVLDPPPQSKGKPGSED